MNRNKISALIFYTNSISFKPYDNFTYLFIKNPPLATNLCVLVLKIFLLVAFVVHLKANARFFLKESSFPNKEYCYIKNKSYGNVFLILMQFAISSFQIFVVNFLFGLYNI